MINANDFFSYCAGASLLVFTGFGSVSLLAIALRDRRERRSPVSSVPAPMSVQEPANDALVDQLQTFRTQRFAPPIGRRQPPGDAGPREPGMPTNRPPAVRQLDPRTQRPKPVIDNVVVLPLKDAHPPTKKED